MDKLNVRFIGGSFDGCRIRYINGKLIWWSSCCEQYGPASYPTLDTDVENFVDGVGFCDPANTETREYVFDVRLRRPATSLSVTCRGCVADWLNVLDPQRPAPLRRLGDASPVRPPKAVFRPALSH